MKVDTEFVIERITIPTKDQALDINRLLEQQSPESDHRQISELEIQKTLNNSLFYLLVLKKISTDGSPKRIIGMASIFFQRNLARWIAEIHDVVVDEEYRGRGFGKLLTQRLMEEAHKFCVDRNIKLKLYLTSRPSRQVANAMYQSLGFELVAQSHGQWGTNLYKIMVEPKGFRGIS